MPNFDEVFERIKYATHTRTQIDLATVLDIRQSSISDAKRRNSIPSDWCMKLFDRFGLNPDWIKKGTGPMYLRTETGYAPVEEEASTAAREDVSLYSDLNAKSTVTSVFSMQPGGHREADANFETLPQKVVGKLNIPLSLAGEGIQVFLLDSTSMEPFLRKGAHVGVDTFQKQVVSGELYAVTLPYEGVGIKRLFPDSAKNFVLLRAENPQHPEISLPLEKLDEIVYGRVVWAISKY